MSAVKEETNRPVFVGEFLRFEYPDEPRHSCILRVVRVDGAGDDDFVYFDDGTWSTQRALRGVPRKCAGGQT